jgi:catechol 2,3-dioxygenase-like lactoylglutathione lyase family enzyme
MFLGLRTVIYHAPDLAKAKAWYSTAFGAAPYFDEPFYVGFEIGGFELGLNPDVRNVKVGTTESRTGGCPTSRRRIVICSTEAPSRAVPYRMWVAISRWPRSQTRSAT